MNLVSPFMLCSFLAFITGVVGQGDSIVQTYFVPLPEESILETFNAIDNRAISPVMTLISIAIASDGTKIYYDHWEDGYDDDPTNPAADSSTLIWGDGNTTNGEPPNFASDALNGGNVVILSNNVPANPRGNDTFFDGKDRISVTLPVAITRSAYPGGTGSLMAGAVEVFDVSAWGTKYIAPIGDALRQTDPFELALFYVMAGEDSTDVFVNGEFKMSLDAGENYVLELPTDPGLELTSSAPVQVDLIGGDLGSNYETRWFAQVPFEKWSDEYVSPVAEDAGSSGFWIYNPNQNDITVKYEGGNIIPADGDSFTVGSNSTAFVLVISPDDTATYTTPTVRVGSSDQTEFNGITANYTGLKFSTDNGDKFLPIAQIDADGDGDEGTNYDWGFPLLPLEMLSSQALVGLGYGCTDNDCGINNVTANNGDQDRSVVWVTPIENATINVDFNGDGTTDVSYDVDALNSLRLNDTDQDMTGAIISAVKRGGADDGDPAKIAVAWGQDPIYADSGQRKQLDLGTVILPLPNPLVSKRVVNVTNPDNSLDPQRVVDQTGDVIHYEITVTNIGFGNIDSVVIQDLLITDAGGAVNGPFSSFNDANNALEKGETWTYTGSYTVTESDIQQFRSDSSHVIKNIVLVELEDPLDDIEKEVVTRIFLAEINGNVTEDQDNDDTGDVPLSGILITLRLNGTSDEIATTLTDSNGFYEFTQLEAGDYEVHETNNPLISLDVDDKDQGDLNLIAVIGLVGGDVSTGNYFVDEQTSTTPSASPSAAPSSSPSSVPSSTPSTGPSQSPSVAPSDSPSKSPSGAPSLTPSRSPSAGPSQSPSDGPSSSPTITDSQAPSSSPSQSPSNGPSSSPSLNPSSSPSVAPSDAPSSSPSDAPSLTPSVSPSNEPSKVRSMVPSPSPSERPSKIASDSPSSNPSSQPSWSPSAVPSSSPSQAPSLSPSAAPSLAPSAGPSQAPSDGPSSSPTIEDSARPSSSPSQSPSMSPSASPSVAPSSVPTELDRFKISGNVQEDIDNDDVGEIDLENVLISLSDVAGTIIATTLTNSDGDYEFESVVEGTYFVIQTNLNSTFQDVTDIDLGDLNNITVNLNGTDSTGNDFVDERFGSISGSVTVDTFDGTPIPLVVLQLKDGNNTVIATTVTDDNGVYIFDEVSPGDYTIEEANSPDFPADLRDEDTEDDGDSSDNETTVDNQIDVTVTSNEDDAGNDFVDTAKGSISGNVTSAGGAILVNITIVLQNSIGLNISTVETDANGEYEFTGISPGDYVVIEENSPMFPDDVSDYDVTDDGDADDGMATAPDNMIKVTLAPGEADSGNNFVDTAIGNISGTVKEDLNNNDEGDVALEGVLITLKIAGSGDVVGTTLTNTDGFYVFTDIGDGNYLVLQTNLNDTFIDVMDKDGGDLNEISVTLANGGESAGNDFVDERFGSIGGSVNDDDGDPLPSVLLELKDSNNTTIATTITDTNGEYLFENVPPGDYTLEEEELVDYPVDIQDEDTADDGDAFDNDTTIDNMISVTVTSNEDDIGNDFVDSNKGSITGNVTSTDGTPLANVTITLTDSNGNNVTAITGPNGGYSFENLVPGNYTVIETNPPGYPGDESDTDSTNDGDEKDTDETVDNKIEVAVEPGEKDDGNNFVDTPATPQPTPVPTTPSPVTPAPIQTAPPAPIQTAPPAPTQPPPEYCEEINTPNCSTCAPFHSPDYCKQSESFPSLIRNRTIHFRNEPEAVANEGYWFHYLEDKIAGYLLSIEEYIPAPKIFCCVTTEDDLRDCLNNKVIPEGPDGIVIKATAMHSNQGVYVLVNDTQNSADDPLDLLTGLRTSYNDAITALTYLQASKIIVEEFVGTSLPTEYKFHVLNGEVAAIDIIDGRGTECPCYAVVDTNWTRLDQFGCFEPGGFDYTHEETGCTEIDWKTGKIKAGPVKKDLNLCVDVPTLSGCLLQEMIDIALKLGARIGVAMRIDMFVEDNTIYVQEYSANHMNGIRHCAAKLTDDDCIDSCFLGRMWDAAGGPYGGAPTILPSALNGYADLTELLQCGLLAYKGPPNVVRSTCPEATAEPVAPQRPDFIRADGRL